MSLQVSDPLPTSPAAQRAAGVLPVGHAGFAALQLGRRVAAELAREAIDPDAKLSMVDRFALCALALAVDIETSRRAGVEPCPDARDILAGALAEIEASAA